MTIFDNLGPVHTESESTTSTPYVWHAEVSRDHLMQNAHTDHKVFGYRNGISKEITLWLIELRFGETCPEY